MEFDGGLVDLAVAYDGDDLPVAACFASLDEGGEEDAAHAPAVSLGDEAWVRIIAEAAAGFRRRALPPATLIKSLVPLYLGKVATFVAETEAGTAEEAEARLEELALAYERGKDALEALWEKTP